MRGGRDTRGLNGVAGKGCWGTMSALKGESEEGGEGRGDRKRAA